VIRRAQSSLPKAGAAVDVDLAKPTRHHLPVLVVSGTEDPIDRAGRAEELAASVGSRDVELVRIAGVGHLLGVEAPDETARLLRAFIERIGPPDDPWADGKTPYDETVASADGPEPST